MCTWHRWGVQALGTPSSCSNDSNVGCYTFFLYPYGIFIDVEELAIIASVQKNDPNLTDMTNQHGIHVLQIFRQLYVSLLLPELDELKRCVLPDCQQGFIHGGSIGASYLALLPLIEHARLQRKRLYTAFADVRRTFPSVAPSPAQASYTRGLRLSAPSVGFSLRSDHGKCEDFSGTR